MSVDELVEELADFWWSAIRAADWDRRMQILGEVHLQLWADLESRTEVDALWGRLVAVLVERLGFPPVEGDAQARIYARSADVRHRSAAALWHLRRQSLAEVSGMPGRGERRRSHRHVVDVPAELWAGEGRADCRLVDISYGGTRLAMPGVTTRPEPGDRVCLAMPPAGTRAAIVVFARGEGIGCRWQMAGGLGGLRRDRGPRSSGGRLTGGRTCERFVIPSGRYRIDL